MLASSIFADGLHHLTATYEGNENYTSVDTLITFEVLKSDPVVTITSEEETTKYGQDAHFTVELTNPYSTEDILAPTGHVWLTTNNADQPEWVAECTFVDSADATSTYNCESATLYANEAAHTLTVNYAGDDNYTSTEESSTRLDAPKELTTIEHQVDPFTPEVTVTQSLETTQYGDEVTFTVTVVGTGNEGVEAPVGTVVLTSSAQEGWELTCSTIENAEGAALTTYTCAGTSATLIADLHEITATFTPADSFLGYNYTTETGDITHEVIKQDPLMTLDASPVDTNHYGEETTFTVTLSGTDKVDSPATGAEVLAPSGEVTLHDSENPDWIVECTAPSAQGVLGGVMYTCTGHSPLLSVGSHTITAVYEGDEN